MAQEAAFTSSAMATALENSSVSYEELADIEKEFDDAETEISKFESHSLSDILKRIFSSIMFPLPWRKAHSILLQPPKLEN
jgi:hypothetical protein